MARLTMKRSQSPYEEGFHLALATSARRSAERIVPFVLALTQAHSVIDVGCGLGDWLAVFAELGVADLFGVDGEYVDQRALKIPRTQFRAVDLLRPLQMERTFDLAVSLEVAEHLPTEVADSFISSLVALAPLVLFSAAIPKQGGDHHVNEQWPSYWAEKFSQHGFVALDCIRRKFWDDEAVDYWYSQNTILFARSDQLVEHRDLAEFHDNSGSVCSLVHPKQYLKTSDPLWTLARAASTLLPISVRDRLVWRLRPVLHAMRSGRPSRRS